MRKAEFAMRNYGKMFLGLEIKSHCNAAPRAPLRGLAVAEQLTEGGD